MSKICQISGKKVQFGNNVSKAINKTKEGLTLILFRKILYS